MQMNKEVNMKKLFVILLLVGMLPFSTMAQEDGDGLIEAGEDTTMELQKASQNPVADLISVPFQNNTTFETGPKGRTQNILNIQPVIPFNLNENWNLITRTIIPIINQPPLYDGMGRTCGLVNIKISNFL
jgi:hypothetical protein